MYKIALTHASVRLAQHPPEDGATHLGCVWVCELELGTALAPAVTERDVHGGGGGRRRGGGGWWMGVVARFLGSARRIAEGAARWCVTSCAQGVNPPPSFRRPPHQTAGASTSCFEACLPVPEGQPAPTAPWLVCSVSKATRERKASRLADHKFWHKRLLFGHDHDPVVSACLGITSSPSRPSSPLSLCKAPSDGVSKPCTARLPRSHSAGTHRGCTRQLPWRYAAGFSDSAGPESASSPPRRADVTCWSFPSPSPAGTLSSAPQDKHAGLVRAKRSETLSLRRASRRSIFTTTFIHGPDAVALSACQQIPSGHGGGLLATRRPW